jgi:hypothetical protein
MVSCGVNHMKKEKQIIRKRRHKPLGVVCGSC